MRCPRCGIESPGQYCPKCGMLIAMVLPTVMCPRCGNFHSLFSCPVCGLTSPTIQPPRQLRRGLRDILSAFWGIAVILMFIVFAICLAALIYASLVMIFPSLQAGQLESFPILTIFPQLMVLFWIEGAIAVAVYFTIIFSILILMYIWLAASDGKGVVQTISAPMSSLLLRLRSRNRWAMVAQLFLAVQFFQLTYALILILFGVELTGPPGQPTENWLLLFNLAEAPVYEEIISRVAMIGLPMFIGSVVIRSARLRHGGVPSNWGGATRRSYFLGSVKYLWGGTVDRRSPRLVFNSALTLTLISSFFFSAAHSNYGDWKLLPTFIAGLALGYAYLRGGLLASILLHFTVNMFSGAALIVQDDIAALVVLSLMTWAIIAIGSGFFTYYCVYALNLLGERFRASVSEPRPAPTPYYQQQSVFAPICPYCGWPESKYIEGKLMCMKCGTER